MDGKVVIVTGASGALGKVVAEVALARGARVAGVDHAPTETAATENRIDIGGVDLTDATQAKKAIDAVASHFGAIHALINIAGGFAFEAIAEGDPRTWQRMYALNVLTALNASRSALPHLAASGNRPYRQCRRDGRAAGRGRHGRPMPRQKPACIASPKRSPPNGRAASPSTRSCHRPSIRQPIAPACRKPISPNG